MAQCVCVCLQYSCWFLKCPPQLWASNPGPIIFGRKLPQILELCWWNWIEMRMTLNYVSQSSTATGTWCSHSTQIMVSQLLCHIGTLLVKQTSRLYDMISNWTHMCPWESCRRARRYFANSCYKHSYMCRRWTTIYGCSPSTHIITVAAQLDSWISPAVIGRTTCGMGEGAWWCCWSAT